MKNGISRYYKMWNRDPGPNYFVFDRTTGKKVFENNDKGIAEAEIRKLNEADRMERGIVIENEVETPSDYYGIRDRIPKEIAPMVRHK